MDNHIIAEAHLGSNFKDSVKAWEKKDPTLRKRINDHKAMKKQKIKEK